jgi:hypothetical protein
MLFYFEKNTGMVESPHIKRPHCILLLLAINRFLPNISLSFYNGYSSKA